MFLVRFWGWTENEREAALDLAELRARAQQNLPLYGESDQPEWVQQAAYSNSGWSQLKFREPFLLTPQDMSLLFLGICRGVPNVCSRPFGPRVYYSSLTDTTGLTLSTTSITAQTRLNIRNKRIGRVPHNISLYSASFPSALLFLIHTRLLAVLYQLVDNALPHCVVDCLGFPQLLFEPSHLHFQLLHPGIRRGRSTF